MTISGTVATIFGAVVTIFGKSCLDLNFSLCFVDEKEDTCCYGDDFLKGVCGDQNLDLKNLELSL
jgi:hypothetical protein